jgi:hypothetical protein
MLQNLKKLNKQYIETEEEEGNEEYSMIEDPSIEKIFNIFKELFVLHVLTKTTDTVFHEIVSKKNYEKAFEIVHSIYEARQNIGLDSSIDCEEAGERSYNCIVELKSIIEEMVKSNKDIGLDNMLRSAAEQVNDLVGNNSAYSQK